MKDEDCLLLNLYGDGKRFLEPVWYSCGKCEECKRISRKITMADYIPKYRYKITTFELVDSGEWKETLQHVFKGDSSNEIDRIIKAHTKTDVFFEGSFVGQWNGIMLRNEYGEIEENI